MKRRSLLESILKKAGVTDAEITELFTDLDGELDDTKATAYLASLMTADEAKGNDTIFKEVKSKAKAEALDPIDKMLLPYEKKLSADAKAEYAKFGADSFKKYNFLMKTFDELGTKTGDKNFDELQDKFTSLQGKIDAGDYVPKADVDTFKTATSKAQEDSTMNRLLVKAIQSGKLRDVTNDRHFERNFIADAKSLLDDGLVIDAKTNQKSKGILDVATGNIMRADSPDQPLLLNGRGATIADLADQTMSTFDWVKKGDVAPSGGISVEQIAGAPGTMSAAKSLMMSQEQGDRK